MIFNYDVSDLHGAISAITPLDTTPTSGSAKGITSGAVYTALNGMAIQSGVSGNVLWVRFPDGTQIVYGAWTAPANETYINITYPVSFTGPPPPAIMAWGGLQFKTFRCPNSQPTFAVLVEESGASATAYDFNFLAIGTWK